MSCSLSNSNLFVNRTLIKSLIKKIPHKVSQLLKKTREHGSHITSCSIGTRDGNFTKRVLLYWRQEVQFIRLFLISLVFNTILNASFGRFPSLSFLFLESHPPKKETENRIYRGNLLLSGNLLYRKFDSVLSFLFVVIDRYARHLSLSHRICKTYTFSGLRPFTNRNSQVFFW